MPLIRRPSGPSPDAAAAAASAKATAAAPDPLEQLARLKTGSDDERWAAARAAAELPGGTAALRGALANEANPRVREAMFTSLARIATAESVEAVLPFLRSDDAQLRTGAMDALGAMPSATWPYLVALLHDDDPDVRVLSCELARSMPPEQASGLLTELLDAEQQPNVCAAAVEALAEIGGAQALPALARCQQRFQATPFLVFAIKIAADRIRSQPTQPRSEPRA